MQAIKIIYVFGHPLRIGGHFKSALAMVKNLERMGHHVVVLAPGGVDEMVQEFTDAGAGFHSIMELKKCPFFPNSFGTKRILKIAQELSIDIIHAQDFRSIGRSYLAVVLLGKPFVFTSAGGYFRHNLPPARAETVFFSRELIDIYPRKYHLFEDNLHLIRARIDRCTYKPEENNPDFIRKYELPESGKKIVMALRLEESKKPQITTIIAAADAFSTNKTNVYVIVAGEGPLLPELKKKAVQINRKKQDGSVLHFVGPIFEAAQVNQLYNYADVVVGSGRGILEAMACRKPVVVLGENGEAEVVNRKNIEEVAYFNFSGRHFRNRSELSEPLDKVLKRLLADEKKLIELGKYSLEYIRAEMDARAGAKQLLDLYQKSLHSKNTLFDYVVWYAKASVIVIYLRAKKIIFVISKNLLGIRQQFIPKIPHGRKLI